MYNGIVTKIQTFSLPNCDNIQGGRCLGYSVVVSSKVNNGELGVYFPADTQLSHNFCTANQLYRTDPLTGEKLSGYIEANRRVKCVKLRGNLSDGIWLPIACLSYTGIDINQYSEGDKIVSIKGDTIARRYQVISDRRMSTSNVGPKTKKKKKIFSFECSLFKKHHDTAQLQANLHNIADHSLIYITEKIHGTSGRSAYLPVTKLKPKSFWDKIFFRDPGTETTYRHLYGSRNVDFDPDLSARDHFRLEAHNRIAPFLRKGETFYYEIAGYANDTSPIMPSHNLSSKDNVDRDIAREYNCNRITYTYGCAPGELVVYVYRITQTLEDGTVIELPFSQVITRCLDLGIKHVPLLGSQYIDRFNGINVSDLMDSINEIEEYGNLTNDYFPFASPNTFKEGVCVRTEGTFNPGTTYKYKFFNFKYLEGIAKDSGQVDIEEQEQTTTE